MTDYNMTNIIRSADSPSGLPAIAVFTDQYGRTFEVLLREMRRARVAGKPHVPSPYRFVASMPHEYPADSTLDTFGAEVSERGRNLPELLQAVLNRDWALDLD